MATPNEIALAAQAYVEAVEALEFAQAAFDIKEGAVQALIASEQAAVIDATGTLNATVAALESARTTARAAVSGWTEANAALDGATVAHNSARTSIATLLAPFVPSP